MQALRVLDRYMLGHTGFIAGGCFKNILTSETIKDIDVFFDNETNWANACDHFKNDSDYVASYKNKNVTAFKNKHTNIRVELVKAVFGSPQEIIDMFDFTITKFAYYKKTENSETEYRIIHHKDFFEHLQMKRLVIDNQLSKPISSFERTYKYRSYGYNMCRESKIKLLNAIKDTDFTEADLSKSLYDGMD